MSTKQQLQGPSKKLVEDGFIERRQDKDDKRSYLLYVTEKGETIRPPDIEDMFKEWNDLILEGFSDDESDQMIKYMERIYQNVIKHHESADIKCSCQKDEDLK